MKQIWKRIAQEDEGVLTFEWILLVTVLVIGVVGGLSAVRDAVLTELGDVVEATIALDQSYIISRPWEIVTPDGDFDGASGSSYTDSAALKQGRSPARSLNDQCCFSNADCTGEIENPY